MDSVKTKAKKYTLVNAKAVAGIVLIPENGQFRAYVAWEWEDQAMHGNFAIIESNCLVDKSSLAEVVNNIADYGTDVTHKSEIRQLFGSLF
jgi:hypothetical protein